MNLPKEQKKQHNDIVRITIQSLHLEDIKNEELHEKLRKLTDQDDIRISIKTQRSEFIFDCNFIYQEIKY